MKEPNIKKDPGSYRDNSGFIFYNNKSIYRQINLSYKENYELLLSSGLYSELITNKQLVSHEDVIDIISPDLINSYKIIKPKQLKFISYPYEWCFSQLKDAALLTLEIQRIAINRGMSLKDASAYNVQFLSKDPIFIDTLSFEKYNEGEPWLAYGQFCRHFVAPLVLMSKKDPRLLSLLLSNMDGVPLDLTSNLLPFTSRFNFFILAHIHLHSKSIQKYEKKNLHSDTRKMSKFAMLSLIDHLSSGIRSLNNQINQTEWSNYYTNTNYTEKGFERKKEIVNRLLEKISPEIVYDIGANNGTFSRIASKLGIETISMDIDDQAVEQNYLYCKTYGEQFILPLHINIANPTPSIGWANKERKNLQKRVYPDTVLALALIHHLVITHNLTFDLVAKYLSKMTKKLIIEFVPVNDSKVQQMLLQKRTVSNNYNKQLFELEFLQYFEIEDKIEIEETERSIYLMRKIQC